MSTLNVSIGMPTLCEVPKANSDTEGDGRAGILSNKTYRIAL